MCTFSAPFRDRAAGIVGKTSCLSFRDQFVQAGRQEHWLVHLIRLEGELTVLRAHTPRVTMACDPRLGRGPWQMTHWRVIPPLHRPTRGSLSRSTDSYQNLIAARNPASWDDT